MIQENIKKAFITGGAAGLGKFIAEHLIRKGWSVIVLDKIPPEQADQPYLEQLAAYYPVDLASVEKAMLTIGKVIESHPEISLWINNAAIKAFNDFVAFTPGKIEDILNVNFRFPVMASQYVLPVMQKRGTGRIIQVSSVSGFYGYSSGSLYCSTKSGLIRFTESVGRELAEQGSGVTMNVLCPDSFSNLDGTAGRHQDYILKGIIKAIDRCLESSVSGKVFIIAPVGTRIRLFLFSLYRNLHDLFK